MDGSPFYRSGMNAVSPPFAHHQQGRQSSGYKLAFDGRDGRFESPTKVVYTSQMQAAHQQHAAFHNTPVRMSSAPTPYGSAVRQHSLTRALPTWNASPTSASLQPTPTFLQHHAVSPLNRSITRVHHAPFIGYETKSSSMNRSPFNPPAINTYDHYSPLNESVIPRGGWSMMASEKQSDNEFFQTQQSHQTTMNRNNNNVQITMSTLPTTSKEYERNSQHHFPATRDFSYDQGSMSNENLLGVFDGVRPVNEHYSIDSSSADPTRIRRSADFSPISELLGVDSASAEPVSTRRAENFRPINELHSRDSASPSQTDSLSRRRSDFFSSENERRSTDTGAQTDPPDHKNLAYKARLASIYAKYQPHLLGSEGQLLEAVIGSEEEVVSALEQKYAAMAKPTPSSSRRDGALDNQRTFPPSQQPNHYHFQQSYVENPARYVLHSISQTPLRSSYSDPSKHGDRASPARPSFHDRLRALYMQYAPHKVGHEDAFLKQVVGKEELALTMLQNTYESAHKARISESQNKSMSTYPAALPNSNQNKDSNQTGIGVEKYRNFQVERQQPALSNTRYISENNVNEVPRQDNPYMMSAPSTPGTVSINSSLFVSPARSHSHNPHKQRLTQIYQQYAPHKVGQEDALLAAARGQEAETIDRIEEKYKSGNVSFSGRSLSRDSPHTTPDRTYSHKERLSAIYRRYAPHKVGQEDKILQAAKGREAEAIDRIEEKYKLGYVSTPGNSRHASPNPYKSRLTAIYRRHAPHKLGSEDAILRAAVGREAEAIEKIEEKYRSETDQGEFPSGSLESQHTIRRYVSPTRSSLANLQRMSSSGQVNPHKKRLTALYQQYAPHKVGQEDALLQAIAGREEEFIAKLEHKYSQRA